MTENDALMVGERRATGTVLKRAAAIKEITLPKMGKICDIRFRRLLGRATLSFVGWGRGVFNV